MIFTEEDKRGGEVESECLVLALLLFAIGLKKSVFKHRAENPLCFKIPVFKRGVPFTSTSFLSFVSFDDETSAS